MDALDFLPTCAQVFFSTFIMLRYTTIHHDVVTCFGLTLAEYMVADSIMQQTKYKETCKQGPTEMGRWLNLDEKTVRRAVISLKKKKLIKAVGHGLIATDKFIDSVRFSNGKTDKMSAQTDKMSKHTIYINNKSSSELRSQESERSFSAEEVTTDVVPCDEEGYEIPVKKTKKNKVPELYELWGKVPRNWYVNKSQRTAAENLMEEHTLAEIKKALAFGLKHRSDEFCPDVSTPWDLDTKWKKLLTYRNKQ